MIYMRLPIKKRGNGSRTLAPFEHALSIRDDFDRFFDSFFSGPFDAWFQGPRFNTGFQGFWPKVDISETSKEITIKANMPGVDQKDVQVELDGSSLIISGYIEEEKEEKDAQWHHMERETGSFRRIFDLPASANLDQITSSVKNGLLIVVVGKTEEARTKKVEVVAEQ